MRRGFTLMEVLIALAIMAVAFFALLAGQARVVRANARAWETTVLRRTIERLWSESMLSADSAALEEWHASQYCRILPWSCVWPESGTNARTWRGWNITPIDEPALGLILPLAREK